MAKPAAEAVPIDTGGGSFNPMAMDVPFQPPPPPPPVQAPNPFMPSSRYPSPQPPAPVPPVPPLGSGQTVAGQYLEQLRALRQGNQDMLRTIEQETGMSFGIPDAFAGDWSLANQSPTQRMVQSIPQDQLAQPEPPDAGPAAVDNLPTATPSVFRPSREPRPARDQIASGPRKVDPDKEPWKPDWRNAFLMMQAVKQPPPVGTGIPAPLPIMPEPPRPAPPWQSASGFRPAFRPPPSMASFLQS